MTRDPIRTSLCHRRLRVREVRRPERGYEEFDLDHFARRRVDDPRPLSGVVDEGLVPRDVHLPHHEPAPTEPLAVAIAKHRVPKAVRMLLEVLVVKQVQRHAGSMTFAMDPDAVGLGPSRRGHDGRIQPRFELGVVA